jgi:hypothetical protein
MSETAEAPGVIRPPFDEAFLKEAENYANLGPAYFDARAVVEHVMPDGSDETLTVAMEPVIKAFTDAAYEKLSERVQSWLFLDVKNNLQHQTWRMVDATVQAILGGESWSVDKHVLGSRYDCGKIRAKIAAMIPKELQDARIAELEADLASAKEEIRRLRERY